MTSKFVIAEKSVIMNNQGDITGKIIRVYDYSYEQNDTVRQSPLPTGIFLHKSAKIISEILIEEGVSFPRSVCPKLSISDHQLHTS